VFSPHGTPIPCLPLVRVPEMQRHKESRRAAGLDFGSGSGQSFRRVMYTSAVTDSRIAATITPTDISSAGVVRAVAITAVRAPMRNSTFAFITELSSRALAREMCPQCGERSHCSKGEQW
jgi:hypothetical protein